MREEHHTGDRDTIEKSELAQACAICADCANRQEILDFVNKSNGLMSKLSQALSPSSGDVSCSFMSDPMKSPECRVSAANPVLQVQEQDVQSEKTRRKLTFNASIAIPIQPKKNSSPSFVRCLRPRSRPLIPTGSPSVQRTKKSNKSKQKSAAALFDSSLELDLQWQQDLLAIYDNSDSLPAFQPELLWLEDASESESRVLKPQQQSNLGSSFVAQLSNPVLLTSESTATKSGRVNETQTKLLCCDWTDEEKLLLFKAYAETDPRTRAFWKEISTSTRKFLNSLGIVIIGFSFQGVGRSSIECQRVYESQFNDHSKSGVSTFTIRWCSSTMNTFAKMQKAAKPDPSLSPSCQLVRKVRVNCPSTPSATGSNRTCCLPDSTWQSIKKTEPPFTSLSPRRRRPRRVAPTHVSSCSSSKKSRTACRGAAVTPFTDVPRTPPPPPPPRARRPISPCPRTCVAHSHS